MPTLVAALLAAVLAALTLAACGGGDSSTSESSSSSTSQPTTANSGSSTSGKSRPTKKAKAGKSQQSTGSSGGKGKSGNSGSSSGAEVAPLKVSGGGSGQYRTKGGDNSIQDFGEESDESELQQAAEALHAFYVARAEEDWARACSYLAKSMAKQLEELASRSPQMKGVDCAAVLHALTRPLPPSAQRELTLVNAGSLRREGERAFLIYTGAENETYAIPMQNEGGAWKVAGLGATPLS